MFSRVSDFSYAPADATVTVSLRRRRRVRHARRPVHAPPAAALRARRGTCRSSCAARASPAARSTTSARPRRSSATSSSRSRCSRPAGTGRPTRRTSTTRQRDGEVRARGDLLLRDRQGARLPAGVRHRRTGPSTCWPRSRTGDVVLIPHGWHGPSIAAPGYDLYYLNVMAGSAAERAWRFCDDPAHAWVRGTWARPAQSTRGCR